MLEGGFSSSLAEIRCDGNGCSSPVEKSVNDCTLYGCTTITEVPAKREAKARLQSKYETHMSFRSEDGPEWKEWRNQKEQRLRDAQRSALRPLEHDRRELYHEHHDGFMEGERAHDRENVDEERERRRQLEEDRRDDRVRARTLDRDALEHNVRRDDDGYGHDHEERPREERPREAREERPQEVSEERPRKERPPPMQGPDEERSLKEQEREPSAPAEAPRESSPSVAEKRPREARASPGDAAEVQKLQEQLMQAHEALTGTTQTLQLESQKMKEVLEQLQRDNAGLHAARSEIRRDHTEMRHQAEELRAEEKTHKTEAAALATARRFVSSAGARLRSDDSAERKEDSTIEAQRAMILQLETAAERATAEGNAGVLNLLSGAPAAAGAAPAEGRGARMDARREKQLTAAKDWARRRETPFDARAGSAKWEAQEARADGRRAKQQAAAADWARRRETPYVESFAEHQRELDAGRAAQRSKWADSNPEAEARRGHNEHGQGRERARAEGGAAGGAAYKGPWPIRAAAPAPATERGDVPAARARPAPLPLLPPLPQARGRKQELSELPGALTRGGGARLAVNKAAGEAGEADAHGAQPAGAAAAGAAVAGAAAAGTAAAAAPARAAPSLFEAAVPAGARVGQLVQVHLPDGRSEVVEVPAGASPGGEMLVPGR